MAELSELDFYKLQYTGQQVDAALGQILNGEVQQAVEDAQEAAEQAQAAQAAVENLGVEASSLPSTALARVTKTVGSDGAVTLTFGIPKGDTGPVGPAGPQGNPGVAVATDGLWALHIDSEGHLILDYDGDTPPDLEIDENGHLIYTVNGQTVDLGQVTGGGSGGGGDWSLPAGTSYTTGSASAKTVSISGFTLTTGALVCVDFQYGNTAASPTLNVSGTGAKTIRVGSALEDPGQIKSGMQHLFRYDGAYWQLMNPYAVPGGGSGGGNVTDGEDVSGLNFTGFLTADSNIRIDFKGNRLQGVNTPTAATDAVNKQYVDEQSVSSIANLRGDVSLEAEGFAEVSASGSTITIRAEIPFGQSASSAASTAKTVSISGFTLKTGAVICVEFTNTNTTSTPTLNVSRTGVKYIRVGNSAPSSGQLRAGVQHLFRYDGTYWQLMNPYVETGGGGTAGVSSFKGRTGAVVPQSGDYTAEMVGAVSAHGASEILITPDGGQSGYYLGAHGSSMGNGVLTLNDVYGSGPIRVNGVKYPEDAYDAANKGYVDQITNAIQRGLSL